MHPRFFEQLLGANANANASATDATSLGVKDTPTQRWNPTMRDVGMVASAGIAVAALGGSAYFYLSSRSLASDMKPYQTRCAAGTSGACWQYEGAWRKASSARDMASDLLIVGLASLGTSGTMLLAGQPGSDEPDWASGSPSSGKRATVEVLYGTATVLTATGAYFAVRSFTRRSDVTRESDRCFDGDAAACDRATVAEDDANHAGGTGDLFAASGMALTFGTLLLQRYVWPNELGASAPGAPTALILPSLDRTHVGGSLSLRF